MKKRQWLIAGIHVSAWLIFLLLPILMLPGDLMTQLSQKDLMAIGIQGLVLIAVYYFNALWMIPRLLARYRYVWYATFVVGIVLLVPFVFRYSPLMPVFKHKHHASPPPTPPAGEGFRPLPPQSGQPNPAMQRNKPPMPPDGRIPFKPGAFLVTMVLLLSTGISVTGRWLKTEQELAQTARERTESELALLRSQFNPHFLFNTLNNLYALSVRKSDAAPEAILKLAGLMRYILEESPHERVALGKEISSLRDYLALQQLRLTKQVTVTFETGTLPEAAEIPPLLLFPLVENAFKHGLLPDQPCEILIRLQVQQNLLEMHVINALSLQQPLTDSGRGLIQFRRRLHLIYGDAATLDTGEKDGKFIAALSIPLENLQPSIYSLQ